MITIGITILVGTFGFHREYQVHTNTYTHSLIILITSRIYIFTELHIKKKNVATVCIHRSRNTIVKMVLKLYGPVI